MTSLTLSLKPFTDAIGDRDLERLCGENPDLRFEINTAGKLVVMSPTGSESGKHNGRLFFQVELWNSRTKLGVTFDSSTGFKLSNGAIRSPDVSWIAMGKWNSLTREQKRKFAPIDPDFVIELMSPTDEYRETQQKMQEYMSCGVKLGWLINPDAGVVEIYKVGKKTQVLKNPVSLSGEDILPELTVNLEDIFDS